MVASVILSYFWWHIYTKAFRLDRDVCFWQVMTKDIPCANFYRGNAETLQSREVAEEYGKAFKIFVRTVYFR